MGIVRSVFRRKARAFLTIFGITIGVLALVVMGAMAEKLNLLVDGGIEYYSDKVIVADAGTAGMMAAPLSLSRLSEVEEVDGVARASANVSMLIDKDPASVSMGVPPMIEGTDLRGEGYESYELTYAEGRAIKPNERGVVVLGSDLVEKLDAELGGDVTIRDTKFEVVGILDKTLTAPDQTATMSLADAQALYATDLPTALRDTVDVKDLCTGLVVYPDPGEDPDKLAKTINGAVGGVKATGPQAFEEQIVDSMALINSIIFGIAIISLLVGGLSVINTMTMAVAERTREIGVRKAIGASHGAIMRQFVGESAFIGLLGGIVGLALGAAMAAGLNAAGAESSTQLFLVTARLAAGSVGFALVLGMVSGIYPAWHAARLNPVHALRFE